MKVKSLLLAALIVGLTPIGQTSLAAEREDVTYVRMIGGIFRLHLGALEHIVNTNSAYADNVVRHAEALGAAPELLDHVVDKENKDAGGAGPKWPWKNDAEYEKFMDASRIAGDELVDAAQKWLAGTDKAALEEAIYNVRTTCGNCHLGKKDW